MENPDVRLSQQKLEEIDVLLTVEEIEKIVRMYTRQNCTITDISLIVFGSESGYSRHQISQILKSQGIKIKKRRHNE